MALALVFFGPKKWIFAGQKLRIGKKSPDFDRTDCLFFITAPDGSVACLTARIERSAVGVHLEF